MLACGSILVGCGRPKPEPVEVLFAGDSDIEGWNTARYADSANIGVGGAVCRDTRETLDDTLGMFKPQAVVLVCGENDLWEQGVRRTFNDFSAVVERIHQAGASVIYMGTKPEPLTADLHSAYRDYDALIRGHAIDLAQDGSTPLVMIDVYTAFEALGNPDSLYQNDRLHLSRAGYALWHEWLTTAWTDEYCIVWESGRCQAVWEQ
ncbi:MAG TPA: hypothetical protein DFR83_10820 [Deltaproteobacteria bacterium]|nr:hypothetical protein [Deltaproteobacteria bacterium]